jgi:hypothetical protein
MDLKKNPVIHRFIKEAYGLVLFIALPYFSAIMACLVIHVDRTTNSCVAFPLLSFNWLLPLVTCLFTDFGIGSHWNTREAHRRYQSVNSCCGIFSGAVVIA